MESIRPTSKRLAVALILLGTAVIVVLLIATAAYGSAGFLSSPIGERPVSRRVIARPVVRPVASKAPAAPATRPKAVAHQQPSSGRCGGDLPPCWVMMRESRGDPGAHNPTGCNGRGCYGKWQFDPRTGDGTGTEAEQDAEARRVWDGGRGCQHWNACR